MSTKAKSLIAKIEAAGGQIGVCGDRLSVFPLEAAAPVLDELCLLKFEIIALLHAPGLPEKTPKPQKISASDFDPLAELRPGFIAWFNRNVQLDAEWHAILPPRPDPHWGAGLLFLHRHICAWWPEHSAEVPPDLNEFETLILESGAVIITIRGERLVQGVALAEDLTAHRRFSEAPQGLPRSARAAVVVKPEPRYEFTYDDQGLPVMPHGVRLIRWAPLPSPARLSNCSMVTDVDTFIRTTLSQLDHVLHNRPWLAGNCGVAELVVRLKRSDVMWLLRIQALFCSSAESEASMIALGDKDWREQWLNAIARDDLRDERREKRATTGGRKMIVEFYCGINGIHECARSANSEQVAAVAIYPLCSGYWLSMSRFNTRTEITNAVMAAIYAKWEAESKLKKPSLTSRPWFMRRTSLKQHSGSYAVFNVRISEGTLGEWQEFLTDLLSKSESWVHAPEVTKPMDDRLTREARDKKKEAKLQQKLTEQLFEAGYKVLATKLHPDKGGSHEAMTRLNQVRASLGSQK